MLSGLVALEIVGQLHQVAIDSRSIIKEYALGEVDPTIQELTRIAKKESFKASIKSLSIDKITDNYPLPAIVLKKDDSFLTIIKVNKDEKTLLVFDMSSKQPFTLSYEEFNDIATNKTIVLKQSFISKQVRFGFSWFFNQILQYKSAIYEVLIASFVIQLFGLVAPLFTQVILDKVLVHRSMTTLDVLAIAFLVVTVFELILNLIRNFIFAHTTTKIDAKLGSKLFNHLLALPLVYFENRKVGNIIARVRELDQIRDFIANKSVTLIIDVMFSGVFVVVMFLYSTKLTLVVLGFVFVIALINLLITPLLRKRLEEKFQMGAASNSYLVESVTGVQTVKSLALEGSMQKKWEDNLANYVTASFNLSNLSNILGAVSGALQKLIYYPNMSRQLFIKSNSC